MKSKEDDLKRRGYVKDPSIYLTDNLSSHELLKKLDSCIASERTSAIIFLRKYYQIDNEFYIYFLLKHLCKEKALYTKIEIAKTLASGNEKTALLMCDYLGVIGDNQYVRVEGIPSKKKSYPLPRDIIARSLGKMNPNIIPILFAQLQSIERKRLYELMDAIGYILFYHPSLADILYFRQIKSLFFQNSDDELLQWKIIQCCSSFLILENEAFLNTAFNYTNNKTILLEIKRSLNLILRRRKYFIDNEKNISLSDGV